MVSKGFPVWMSPGVKGSAESALPAEECGALGRPACGFLSAQLPGQRPRLNLLAARSGRCAANTSGKGCWPPCQMCPKKKSSAKVAVAEREPGRRG